MKSFFKKLLISYIAILILPILIMSFLLYSQFDTTLKKEIMANNTNTLNRTAYILDSNIGALYNIKDMLSATSALTPPGNLQDPEKVLALQREFQRYMVSNSFINEICVYFHGEDYIYTSKTSAKLPFFINNSYVFRDWSETEFINDIGTLTAPRIRTSEPVNMPAGKTSELITFLFPVSRGENGATLIFFVERSYIENIIRGNAKENPTEIIILDKSNNLIVSTYDKYAEYRESFDSFLLAGKDSDTISFDGVKFQAVSTASNSTNLRYLMLTPLSHVLEKEHRILLTSCIVLLFLLMCGTLVILLSMKLTYNPIKTLNEFSSSIANTSPDADNEIDNIKGVVNHLAAERKNIIERVTPITQDYILENLIKGRFDSAKMLDEQLKTFNIPFKTAHFYAVLIFSIYEGSAAAEQVKAVMDGFFPSLVKEEHNTRGRFISVIACGSDDPDALTERVSDFRLALRDRLGIQTTIGASNICDEIQKIPTAYIQACSAIDYRLIKGNGAVIPFSSISAIIDEYSFSYSGSKIESLTYFIRHGDIDSINDILDKTLEFIKNDNVPLFIARAMCFDMINIIWKAFDEIQKNFLLPDDDYPNITVLSKYDTVDDLIQILKNFCANICSIVSSQNEKSEDSLINRMLEFIKENYRDGNFTTQLMAEHFDMSLSNISQYFKSRTGQTILDCITHLRITEAKRMLIDSDMSVNDIAYHVGYLNTSSFIRRFKQITGLTPKQFTEEQAKQQD